MKDGGYDDDFSLAVTGASSLIGPVIPPSVPLVIFGVTASVSVGDLFTAGILPGILLAAAMMAVNYCICKNKGYEKRKRATLKEIWMVVLGPAPPCNHQGRDHCRDFHTHGSSGDSGCIRNPSGIFI